jgi:hypothetical protein
MYAANGHALILEMNKCSRIEFELRAYMDQESIVSNMFGVCKQTCNLLAMADIGLEYAQVEVCVGDLSSLLQSARPFSRCFS